MTTVTTTWVAELADALGPDSVLTDPDVTASYARDQAVLAEAGTPAAVVLPRSTAEVVAVLQIAARHGVPVVPRGAGSGLVGASNAVDGGITMVMTRMDDGCDAISAESGLVIGVMGHAGDGDMHPTIVFDAPTRSSGRAPWPRSTRSWSWGCPSAARSPVSTGWAP